ncbi:inactive protein kinase SELMODRAFT_444075-like [Nymphaea colorata]|nr:inactive protein kinase SELMODRAFT_444075-like [Nymphaea colorata]XP_031487963.1 inactive protein kinase SELMODRAFT_444075-like [Nymphaea colorata]XP_031487964.1 inactive protein kinase SELMODRAFT_444075-like [Nymphaea colorata]XP_049934309.1 inactive protein kinase SELMODRAFT_444075-like [Nymphaea colorata]
MNTNLHLRRGKQEKGLDGAEKVVVAVKASREIPKTALVWALSHVVQPGDCITFLVVVPAHGSGKRLWGFPRFSGDCATGQRRFLLGTSAEQKCEITDLCSQMMLQLQDVYDPDKINVKIKIISGSPCGAVAAETKRAQANWVILDKQLKQEEKRCLEELQCNIVVMKRSQPKVLRLNLVGSPKTEDDISHAVPSESECKNPPKTAGNQARSIRAPVATPTSSPELGTSFTTTEAGTGTSSVSSSDPGTSPFLISEPKVGLDLKKGVASWNASFYLDEGHELGDGLICSDSDIISSNPTTNLDFQPWTQQPFESSHQSSLKHESAFVRVNHKTKAAATKSLLEKLTKLELDAGIGKKNYQPDSNFSYNVREAISLSRNAPPGPPPLCSICQHKSPVFGKPPRWFSYAELELATGGFSQANFLAEGGFGSVHRGILPDGQAIAVKQHKLASSQGDLEFCSEVEVLSCAQHRNVVMLIGFCVEDRRRLLVYEYICNGSLDYHLYGNDKETLEWPARQKIAVGAARGLRYLHEECRVGCIVHRDMRPNNILITHDFEPMVGDFGLARWQPDGDKGVDTRVIGTFGYLAPEYAQSGQITEKADVYSFGVVLIELVTGRKAVDLNRPKGQQCLTEWARPLLEECAIEELVDPRLGHSYSEPEVFCMLHAALLCIRRDPHSRPRMSQVLRILEGDGIMETNFQSTPAFDAVSVGSRSGRMWNVHQQYSGPIFNETTSTSSLNMPYESFKGALWEHEKMRRVSCEDL